MFVELHLESLAQIQVYHAILIKLPAGHLLVVVDIF